MKTVDRKISVCKRKQKQDKKCFSGSHDGMQKPTELMAENLTIWLINLIIFGFHNSHHHIAHSKHFIIIFYDFQGRKSLLVHSLFIISYTRFIQEWKTPLYSISNWLCNSLAISESLLSRGSSICSFSSSLSTSRSPISKSKSPPRRRATSGPRI